jgi:hypothetical protein
VDHSTLREDCGEQTVAHSRVSCWATSFCKTCHHKQLQKTRLKTSTDEGSVKLVAEFLAQDRQATCEEISQAVRISPKSVFCILTNDLQKRKICA